jgi:type 2 lantibiotic biosynthesis protein LanM
VSAVDFTRSLSCLVEPALAGLSERLDSVAGLHDSERSAIGEGTAAALYLTAQRKVSRVLLLELNAARITGRLTAGDPSARWAQFVDLSSTRQYWDSLTEHYPTMLPRLRTVLSGRCTAALSMARRLGADRDELAGLLGCAPGALTEVAPGAGDSHRGGQAVAVLTFEAGRVVYKPRSVRVDAVLGATLAEVLADVPARMRIRVPSVVQRDGYGWAEFVTHSYCATDDDLAGFYRGIGHWLGMMRLLGGSDLHAENVIACGPVPIVVDCETLFTPTPAAPPSGFGLAVDLARDLVNATVLRTGMLPSRGVGLGWRGVDASAVGSLAGEQPVTDLPVILDPGSDRARIGYAQAELTIGASHPAASPVLADYWDRVGAGFAEVTAALGALDGRGRLEPLLARFADCPIRVVPRSTEAYTELARMLWHPVSLHDPQAAVERATDLLAKMAEFVPGAPSDPAVIDAEVADLLDGDVPFFTTTPRHGRLTGPGGTAWLPEQDLVAAALDGWRRSDFHLDDQIISATLVSAYLNDGWMPGERRMAAVVPRPADLERRRRALAAAQLCRLRDAALHAEDGTVTWIAAVLNPTGWAVQPLSADLYGGLPGVAVLLAGYRREHAAGRADRVDGVSALLNATLRTMRISEDRLDSARRSEGRQRPAVPGGYIGLGSQIWAWLTLHGWGEGGPDGLARARALAMLMPAAVEAEDRFEVLTGMAGAIVPLLQLAEVTGEDQWTRQAVDVGERLVAAARWKGDTAYWPSPDWPDGLGGFAHGATGIGWALARLTLATGDGRFAGTAYGAFGFEEALYDRVADGWVDLREPDETVVPCAWCHGAVGIGISAADLARRGWPVPGGLVDRAASAADRRGFGWNHTMCHGDLGCWELLDAALAAGHGPAGLDRASLDARVIGSLEDNGAISGLARDAYSPGLFGGLGGVGYQLLRLHPDSDLPSALTLGTGEAPGSLRGPRPFIRRESES